MTFISEGSELLIILSIETSMNFHHCKQWYWEEN